MANLFSWDADQLDTTSLGSIVSVGPRTTISTTVKRQGTGSMRLEILGNDQTQMGIDPGNGDQGTFYNGTWRYYRTWMKFDDAFTWGASGDRKSKATRVKRIDDTPPPLWTMYLRHGSLYVGECSQCSPGGDDPSNALISYNFKPEENAAVKNWQEYIVGVKLQSTLAASDGEFHLWVNGVEITPAVTGMQYRSGDGTNMTEAWGGFMCRPLPQLNSLSTDGGFLYIDDVSIDDTFNSNYAPEVATASYAFSGAGFGQFAL